jgi:hypothetical protein
MKHKTCNIRKWEKHLFHDIVSTNTETLVPSLYPCVETWSIEIFWLLSQPLPHLCSTSLSSAKCLPASCEPLYATNTSHLNQETFLYEYSLNWVLLPTKKTKQNRTLFYGNTFLKHCCRFGYWNQPLNMHMCVSFLHCHEADLCCYLVIHIENLLRPLQLFCICVYILTIFVVTSYKRSTSPIKLHV